MAKKSFSSLPFWGVLIGVTLNMLDATTSAPERVMDACPIISRSDLLFAAAAVMGAVLGAVLGVFLLTHPIGEEYAVVFGTLGAMIGSGVAASAASMPHRADRHEVAAVVRAAGY